MNFDVLFTYLLHPGTAVYVGYNSNLENIDPGLCVRIAGAPDLFRGRTRRRHPPSRGCGKNPRIAE